MEQTVLEWIAIYGYGALFLSLVLGIVGLPVPDEVIMTYVGFLVSQHTLQFSSALLVAFAGSVVGMSISFIMGRYFGQPLLFKYGKRIGIQPAHWERAQNWYEKFGPFVLIIGYFIPGIRHLTAFTAGTSRMRFTSFALFAYTGGFIWTLTFITLGRILGKHWKYVFVYLHKYGIWLIGTALLIASIITYVRYVRKKA